MYKIIYLQAAKNDLYSIGDYYKAEFGKESARKVVKSIQDVIKRLSMFPGSGSLTPDPELNDQGYRMVVSGRYVAVFRVIENHIYIYHIFDTQMDYTKLFE